MKKLMFILALAAGSSVFAGSVNWSAWDDNGTASTDLLLYLFEGNLTDGSKIDSIKDAASATTYVGGAVASGLLEKAEGYYGEGRVTGVDKGDRSYYAVVFDNASIDAATGYQVFGAYTVNVPANGSIGLDMDFTGATSSGWTSISGSTPTPGPSGIPEPTSGLLLLVGGAMLALRRKQK